jgi:TolA-binding protein
MKTIKIFGKDVCSCVIIRIVLSTMAIIALFYLTSCVTPSSVRGKKVYGQEYSQEQKEDRSGKRKKVTKKDEDINEDDEFAELIKEAHAQHKQNNEQKQPQENQVNSDNLSNLLLPLNKQIEVLTANQNQIKSSITGINNDISNIRNDVNEIKETLNLLAKRNTIATTGIEEIEKQEKKKSANQFLMKSDEEAETEPLFTVKANNNSTQQHITEPKQQSKQTIDKTNDKKETNKDIHPEVKSEVKGEITDLNKLSFELTENYLEKKDFAKAIEKLKEIESGLKTEIEKNKHSYLLGESYFGLQQYAKAVEYFIKVLESPDFGNKDNAKLMIAESQIQSGEPTAAKQTYKQLIADYPDSKHIPRARKMLQKL